MTNTERLGDDLAYVRAAINRQRRVVCEYLPAWLSFGAGAFFLTGALVKDLRLQEMITDMTADAIILVATALLLGALFWNRRRNPSVHRGQRQHARLGEQIVHALPVIVWMAGLGLLMLVFEQLGVTQEARKPIIILYSAVCLILIGLRGVSAATGMGIGLAVGGMAKIFLVNDFSNSVLGLCMATGLIAGAWFDRRALAASNGHGNEE